MIGVIADDLTGAAEMGALGLGHGLTAEIVVAGVPSRGADLVCIDTDSRACQPREAARRAARAAAALKEAGAEWVFKKTDSVLRGNVTVELEAVMRRLGLPGALLVPANPSLKRTIVDGRYYIDGRLIHQTDFARDPGHPRSSPRVLELLDRPDAPGWSVAKVGAALPPAGGVIGEAAGAADIRYWAGQAGAGRLMAGGGDFFAGLLPPGAPVPSPGLGQGAQLFVCGSASRATREFVDGQRRHRVPVVALPPEVARTGSLRRGQVFGLARDLAAALESSPRVVLHVGLPLVRPPALAERLAGELVRVVRRVLKLTSIAYVFAEGGATSVALARALGWHRLSVRGQLARGVVVLAVADAPGQTLIIKPGSYSWPESLLAP